MKNLSIFIFVVFLFLITACKSANTEQTTSTTETKNYKEILSGHGFVCDDEVCYKENTTQLFLSDIDYLVSIRTNFYLYEERIYHDVAIREYIITTTENEPYEEAFWSIDYSLKNKEYQIDYKLYEMEGLEVTELIHAEYGKKYSGVIVGDLANKKDQIDQEAENFLQRFLITYDYLID